jgi:hypothetical protein
MLTVAGAWAQQVPGYMGKRLAIGYSLQLSPNFRHSNYSTSGGAVEEENDFNALSFGEFSIKPKGISNVHYLQAEYVLTKKVSVLGAFSYSRAYYAAPTFGRQHERLIYEGRPGLNTFAPMVGIRWYTHQLAPIGTFLELNLSFMMINPDDFTYTAVASQGSGTTNVTATIVPESSTATLLGFKFGKSRMVSSNIKLDFFCSLAIQYPGVSYSATRLGLVIDSEDFGSQNGYFDGNTPANQAVFTNRALGRMFGSHWASTGITVNFMP